MNNQIEVLRKAIIRAHPGVAVTLAPPLHDGGVWTLEVRAPAGHLIIEWAADTGFGISSAKDDTYGEASDENVSTPEEALARINHLLATGEQTRPPIPVMLAQLRECRGLTQQDLANRLGVRQASISGIERRGDIQLSTLSRIIGALGGTVEVYGTFPDQRYRLDTYHLVAVFEEPATAENAKAGTAVDALDAFSGLVESGCLQSALQKAATITRRHAVFGMP